MKLNSIKSLVFAAMLMFVCTANDMGTMPRPLLDRMEIIRLSGYTEDEKLNIAMRYLLPKQVKANGLKENEIDINEDSVEFVANHVKGSVKI